MRQVYPHLPSPYLYNCPLDKVYQQPTIANTDRKVEVMMFGCTLGGAWGVDLRVVKLDGSYPIILAKGTDVDRIEIDGSKPNQLSLKAPKASDVRWVLTDVPNVHVTFNYIDAAQNPP